MLTRMNFVRSNFTIVRYPSCLQGLYALYRAWPAQTLIRWMAVLAVLVWGLGAGWAEDDWPDPVYFPQQQSLPSPPSTFRTQGESVVQDDKPAKKGMWPFRRKKKTESTTTGVPHAVPQIGPRETPPRGDPLLRVAVPFLSESIVVPSGFYLIQPVPQVAPSNRAYALVRQNRIVLQFLVTPIAADSDASASPVTRMPNAPPAQPQASIRLSPDQKSMTIVVQDGEQWFESPRFPVATDTRPVLQH